MTLLAAIAHYLTIAGFIVIGGVLAGVTIWEFAFPAKHQPTRDGP